MFCIAVLCLACSGFHRLLCDLGDGWVRVTQVVGHTIQREGINSACEAKVHRIDVGLSAGCGDGTPQAGLCHTCTALTHHHLLIVVWPALRRSL